MKANASNCIRSLSAAGRKDEAENVVQEAFLLLLARFDTVRVHPNPSGWLMKVVQNLIRHSMDRNQKQSSHEISIEEQITQISAPPKQFFSLRDILAAGPHPAGTGSVGLVL